MEEIRLDAHRSDAELPITVVDPLAFVEPRVPDATDRGSRARNRSLVRATVTSGIAKGTSVLLNALLIPIAIRSLGVDGYGLWMTVTSISSVLVFADFGLSNGLVTLVSEAHGNEDRDAVIKAVSTTFFSLLALSGALLTVVLATAPHVPWTRLLNLTGSHLGSQVTDAVLCFLCLQIAIIPASIAQKVQIGYQEMHWTNSFQIAGSVLSFTGVLVAAKLGLGLVSFIALFSSGPLVGQLACTCVLFGKLRPWLRPRLRSFDRKSARRMAATGGSFGMLQLLAFLGNSTDQIILTRYLGLSAVAEYSVVQRLFSGTSLIQFLLVPLWPAFGEAVARGDHRWARKALKKTLAVTLAVSVGTATIIAFATPVISRLWVPQVRQASGALLAAFVAQSLMTAYGGTMSVFLNNTRTLRPQLFLYMIASVGALAAKFWLVKTAGISGVLWGTFGGYAILYTIPAWRLVQKTLDDINPEKQLKKVAVRE